MKDNIQKLHNLIDYAQCRKLSDLFDAEKAFDQVHWGLMKYVLNAMSFGHEFLKWMNNIYKHQSATVLLNGYISRLIQISRGVRQVCSLSPVLFNVVVEMLAIAVLANNAI